MDTTQNSAPAPDMGFEKLRPDCKHCFGLCCVGLYFSASEGFPADKAAGEPCNHLQPDFRCNIFPSLEEQGLKGCLAFDCFGAGQTICQMTFGGRDWRSDPGSASQMIEAFLIMRQLHELLWYLTEGLTLEETRPIHDALNAMLHKTERLTRLELDSLLKVDVAAHRADVNALLLKISAYVRAQTHQGPKAASASRRTLERGRDLMGKDLRKSDLRGASLRGAYLIGADLRGVDLSWADLIGADFRAADIRGADLSRSIFLTQVQMNTARGDNTTQLPLSLIRPAHWENE